MPVTHPINETALYTCARKGLMHEANKCKCCTMRVSGVTANEIKIQIKT